MRVFIAGLFSETNTRSPRLTEHADFAAGALFDGDASRRCRLTQAEPLRVWRELAEASGYEVVEGFFAYATPGGRVRRTVYEAFRDTIVGQAAAAGPFDLILLDLHGAMAAEDEDDCEGDLLVRLRAAVGREPVIGAELDLHAHLSQRMLDCADVLVSYKEYPHTDVAERAREVFAICEAARGGAVRPAMAAFDCRAMSIWRTSEPPVRRFVDRLSRLERAPGVLSVSFIHGFAHADTADVGARMLVITDGDRGRAGRLATRLGLRLNRLTRTLPPLSLPMGEALDAALAAANGPVLLADVADNPGGGAAGDSTFLLRELIDRGVADVAFGYVHDPQALAEAVAAGLGAQVALAVGGKGGPESGAPVDLAATVAAISNDHRQTSQTGGVSELGRAVRLAAPNGLDMVLTERRQQVLGPDGFERLGIDLAAKRLVVVKSAQHFRRNFEALAGAIVYADSPGACTLEIRRLRYGRRAEPYWPDVEEPFPRRA